MSNKMNVPKILRKSASILLALSMLISAFSIPVSAANDKTDDDRRIIVSMGDSFSSGEGNEPFYGQELGVDKVKSEDWLAHRSTKAWGGMLMLNGVDGTMAQHRIGFGGFGDIPATEPNWYFVASSGAVTSDIWTVQTDKDVPEKQITPQINIFDEIDGEDVDYVTLTLGGNDVGFTEIILAATVGSSHVDYNVEKFDLKQRLEVATNTFANETEQNLTNVYKSIAEKAPNATIIVVGYPMLFSENGGATITKDEAKLINDAVVDIDQKLQNLIYNCQTEEKLRIEYVPVIKAFENHGAYSDDPFIYEIMLGPRAEDINQSALASSYSMHPNEAGVCAYAKCVQAKINELEGCTPVTLNLYNGGTEDNEPVTDATITIYSGAEASVYDTIDFSDENGEFVTYLPNGTEEINYSVSIAASGYNHETLSFDLGYESQDFSVELTPDESTVKEEITKTKQLSQIIEYNEDGNLEAVYDFSYNTDELLSEITTRIYNDGEYSYEERLMYTYNDNGKVVTATSDYLSSGAFTYSNIYTKEYLYTDNGLLSEINGRNGPEEFDTVVGSSKYEYDEDGRMIRSSNWVDGMDLYHTTRYIYDDNGYLVSSEQNGETHNFLTDSRGRVIEEEYEDAYTKYRITLDYSYTPFVVLSYYENGLCKFSRIRLHGASDVILFSTYLSTVGTIGATTALDDLKATEPQFFTDADGYLVKTIGSGSDYYANVDRITEFYYGESYGVDTNAISEEDQINSETEPEQSISADGYTDWQTFLSDKAYMQCWDISYFSPEEYAFIDIEDDGMDELIIRGAEGMGFYGFLIFAVAPSTGIIEKLELDSYENEMNTYYCYMGPEYSSQYNALVISTLRPVQAVGGVTYYYKEKMNMTLGFNVGWDTDENGIYYFADGIRITEAKKDEYMQESSSIEFMPLP